jgi:hypothetical protein
MHQMMRAYQDIDTSFGKVLNRPNKNSEVEKEKTDYTKASCLRYTHLRLHY